MPHLFEQRGERGRAGSCVICQYPELTPPPGLGPPYQAKERVAGARGGVRLPPQLRSVSFGQLLGEGHRLPGPWMLELDRRSDLIDHAWAVMRSPGTVMLLHLLQLVPFDARPRQLPA